MISTPTSGNINFSVRISIKMRAYRFCGTPVFLYPTLVILSLKYAAILSAIALLSAWVAAMEVT